MNLKLIQNYLNECIVGDDKVKVALHINNTIYELTDVTINGNQLRLIGHKSKNVQVLDFNEFRLKINTLRDSIGSKSQIISLVTIMTPEMSGVVTKLNYIKEKRVLNVY